MDTIKITRGNVKMVAHRGVSGLEPQNTLLAFVAAGNRSYFGIETDVHITSDGKYVCMHDDTFEHTAGKPELFVEKMTYEEARKVALYDATGKANGAVCVPSLAEYIETCKRYDKTAVLELKSKFRPQQILEIIGIIEGIDYLDKVIFISFHYQNLVFVKQLKPEQNVQFLVCEITPDLLDKLTAYRMDLDIYYKTMLSKEAVLPFKKAGIRINVWTCDRPEDATTLIENGVDFITSNILE